jgi:hypothetical protein
MRLSPISMAASAPSMAARACAVLTPGPDRSRPLGQAAELTGTLLQFLQVGLALDLVAELHHADAALLQDDGMVIELIPPLVVQLAWLLVHELHAERLAVVRAGFLQVRDPDVHVPHSHDTHMAAFPSFESLRAP